MYKAECKECIESDNDVHLIVQRSGFKWTALIFKNPEHEIPLVINALVRYLADHLSSPEGSDQAKL